MSHFIILKFLKQLLYIDLLLLPYVGPIKQNDSYFSIIIQEIIKYISL